MSKAFDKIAEGLNEALTVARGQTKPLKMHIPAEIDVRAIRGTTLGRRASLSPADQQISRRRAGYVARDGAGQG
jgi:hypothetical protein